MTLFMKRLFIVLLICIVSCGPTVERNNAEGMNGIGVVTLLSPKQEVLNAIKNNQQQYNKALEWKEDRVYISEYGYSDERTPDIKGAIANYNISEDIKIEMRLLFFRDTLINITVGKNWDNIGLMGKAFTTKYGPGHRTGREYDYSEKWISDTAEAVYEFSDDRNPDYGQRKVKDVMDISTKDRRINQEFAEYTRLAIQEQKEEGKKVLNRI